VLKALDDIKIFRNITDGENKEILQDDLENLENWSNTWLLKKTPRSCRVNGAKSCILGVS
jgi:hypothetical protein